MSLTGLLHRKKNHVAHSGLEKCQQRRGVGAPHQPKASSEDQL